jgi:hypothetical protein
MTRAQTATLKLPSRPNAAVIDAARRTITIPTYPDDDYFFHRGQVRVGVILKFVGRTDSGSLWRVEKIVSHFLAPNRRPRYDKLGRRQPAYIEDEVPIVRQLNDDVYLRRLGSRGGTRTCTFSNLTYSAAWRIHHDV